RHQPVIVTEPEKSSFWRSKVGAQSNHGPLALEFILEKGGAAYAKQGSVLPFLKTGQISIFEEAVKFAHPVYIVRPADIPNPALDQAVALLRKIVSDESAVEN
ncbi:hypothetical protein ACFMBG_21905, partial [Leisingera sp. D0M16]|uniref:hypothetical protein n=1 Tax=Leisingera coralii TaxID=3351347 RepID=UPI003B79187B